MLNELTDMHGVSNNELAYLAQNGCSEAYSVLTGRFIFLVRNCAGGYFSDSLDAEDLVQEGFIGLMNAVMSFDPKCGAAFSTFAKLCIDRQIISAVRKSLRKKRIPQSMLVFIGDDTVHSMTAAGADEPENALIMRENYQALLSDIAAKLSKTESDVLRLYLAGKSYDEIAQRLGISKKSADNAMQRVRKKLK